MIVQYVINYNVCDLNRPSPSTNMKPINAIIILYLCQLHFSNSIIYTLLSKSTTLEGYCYFQLTIHTNLLPTNATMTMTISELDYTNYLSGNGTQTGVSVYNEALSYQADYKKYTIWNYQSTTRQIFIVLSYNQTLTLSDYIFVLGQNSSKDLLIAIIDDQQTSGYMLPFNMLDIKASEVFVVAYDSALVPTTYSLPPFMSTYWTENKMTAAVMPWLPFFSECSYQKDYMILNDLIEPQNCSADVRQAISCSDKKLAFDCLIEQYELSSVSQQYWFNVKEKIIFYMFATKLTSDDIQSLRNSSPSYLTQLFDTFYSQLIPVIYRRQSSSQIYVNQFDIVFQVDLNQGQNIEIISAEIIGSYQQTIAQPFGKVTVQVKYLSDWQSLVYYHSDFSSYLIFAIAVAIILSVPLPFLQRYLGTVNIKDKIKFMIAPALKGTAYSLLTAGGFAIIIHILSFYTNYSSLQATYDSNYTDETLDDNNKGRYGLSFVLAGIFIIMTGIKQAFKVNETEQLRIALEDDKWKFDSEEEFVQKIEFSKKNQTSHRRYLFNGILIALLLMVLLEFVTVTHSNLSSIFFLLFIYPLISKAFIFLQKKYLIKSYIFICGLQVALQLFPCYLIINNASLSELTYIYISKYISFFFIEFVLEIFLNWLMVKIEANRESHKLAKFIYQLFQADILKNNSENQYEKALCYSTLTVSLISNILLYPALGLFILLTEKSSQVPSLLMVNERSIIVPILLFITIIPVQLYTVIILVDFLKRYQDLRIEETIKFNHFKFKRTKFRWMNDVFAHNKDIRQEFREYQKFAFSSQLYYVITLIAIGMQMSLLGVITMLEVMYLPFQDPVTIPLVAIIWVICEVLSVAVSFVAVKLKLYEKKPNDLIRQKLAKVDKYLKVDQSEDYLELDAVKDYFMHYNRQWIVHNLHKIFSKQNFRQNNGQLFNKYKHYKSSFKRKQIQEKKKIKEMKLEESKIHKNQELFREPFIVFRNQTALNTSKRIMTYWYYLAKQNLYLKDIVSCVQSEQKQPVCEYCKMDVELEVLQKKEFHSLVNHYRVENVGRMFSETAFLEYYRLNQEFITICLECKEHNLHLQSKINPKSKSSKIVFYWLLMARSRLLHNRSMKESRAE